ncbi:MAG TPA: hypothetical protein VIE67_00645 [Rudaea sp.]|uniref:hypothetical protein n=1 Tax=Rudaea sp. TaxID=2136325 RepID=UPI002F91C9CB
MYLKTSLLAIAMFACATTIASATPSTSGALPVPANRIAGLWSVQADVSECNGGPIKQHAITTLLFHAGGTVTENPRFPPQGAPNVYGVLGTNQRTFGMGTWSYDPATQAYALHLQFDWYVNGTYNGYQTVDREIILSTDDQHASGPVHTVRYRLDGSTVVDLCGAVTESDRL